MTIEPWGADRELTAEMAMAAIREQFPELPARQIVSLGSGWENDAYLVDDAWVFRFPRRREVADVLAREVVLTEVGRRAIVRAGVLAPDYRWRGRPSAAFPYPFAGYQFLHGRPAPSLPAPAASRHLGSQLGRLLTHLHMPAPADVAGRAIPEDGDGCAAWLRALCTIEADLARRESPALAAHLAWFEDAPAPPSVWDTRRFVHNDICPDHVLVDGQDGAIRAVLDFGDAAWADPVLDFVVLPGWLGADGLNAALTAYELPIDSGFRYRLAYLSRVLTLIWLHDAHLMDGDLTMHRAWVRRAFAAIPLEVDVDV